jgi:hypothetical protein
MRISWVAAPSSSIAAPSSGRASLAGPAAIGLQLRRSACHMSVTGRGTAAGSAFASADPAAGRADGCPRPQSPVGRSLTSLVA